jgi:hypothetical protein
MADEKEKDDGLAIEPLPKDGERALRELSEGKMVISRSENDFLYILDFNGQFHMWSHTVGAPGGGQKQFPKNEKYTATVKKIPEIADKVFVAEFDKSLNIYGVMSTAEGAILEMYPAGDPDADADVEFRPWDRKADTRNKTEDEEEPVITSDGIDPFGYFDGNKYVE